MKTQPVIELLAKNPNEMIQCDQDAQVKGLIVDLGITGCFSQKTTGQNETTRPVIFNEHPTHHILIVLYQGHDNPAENGFLAYCLPRSRVSTSEFLEFVRDFLKPTDAKLLGATLFFKQPESD